MFHRKMCWQVHVFGCLGYFFHVQGLLAFDMPVKMISEIVYQFINVEDLFLLCSNVVVQANF